MKAVIPRSPRPIPNTPAKLHGSFNTGARSWTGGDVVAELLRRVELTPDPAERAMQAQRAIGGLMALTAIGAPGIGSAFTHRDFFSRLSALTGSTPDELVTAAGAAT
ncbi:hypothetical protein [Pseudomonas coronafaciens]|uniref:hypothetical protein n=1 Tax=Pseudomonas coronafaciens TaxID=53409 RepID=UPI0005A4DDEF|nr:hypothetical protein [Pseudomonas coronafaciens]KGS16290.1 hypothetical protein OA77_01080 [Pseudomonas coronafaciens]RMV02281.1 hypothetical protein ALP20_00802 [Pseudomonas coronafaciens pv. coronafaciens]